MGGSGWACDQQQTHSWGNGDVACMLLMPVQTGSASAILLQCLADQRLGCKDRKLLTMC
jgi:hypothetical protein